MEATSTAGDQLEYGPTFGEFIGGIFLAVLVTTVIAIIVGCTYHFGWVKPQLDTAQMKLDNARVQLAEAQNQAQASQMSAEQIEAAKSEQYYRGLYDFCVRVATLYDGMELSKANATCNKYIASTRTAQAGEGEPIGWYNQPSPGWQP